MMEEDRQRRHYPWARAMIQTYEWNLREYHNKGNQADPYRIDDEPLNKRFVEHSVEEYVQQYSTHTTAPEVAP